MSRIPRSVRFFRWPWRSQEQIQEEAAEEIRFHLDMRTEELIRKGMSAEGAQVQAHREFGDVEEAQRMLRKADEASENRGRRVEEFFHLRQDVRYALRTLVKSPGLTTVTVLTLGLGIGSVVAIFSLVNAILIQPLPYPTAHRLVVAKHAAPGLGMPEAGQSNGTYVHYQRHNRVFEAIGLYNENVVNVAAGDGDPERIQVALVTHGVFSALGAAPTSGRLFTPEDNLQGASELVVISHDFWQRRFGSDPGIIGRTIELNSAPKQIVGVMEPGFDFPSRETQVWYPFTVDPARAGLAGLHYSSVARLRPGVSPAEAEADLNRLIPSLAHEFGDATPEFLENARLSAIVTPLKDEVLGGIGAALWLLLGSMGFVLLIACANVANLFLARAENRRKEVALRTALGAGRGHLVRYFLSESILLALIGGALGLVLAYIGIQALVAFGPESIPRLHTVGIDGWVLALTVGLAVLTGLLFGAVPILRYRRTDLTSALKEGGRSATTGRERQHTQRLLVASQVALALTLLVGSALMVQSFWRLQNVDIGFDPQGVLTLEVALPAYPYPDYPSQARFWHQILERVRALPGVEAAGAVGGGLPLSKNSLAAFYDDPLAVEDDRARAGEVAPMVTFQSVTPGYFEAMRIPFVEGRRLQPGDRANAGNPVLVSAALAHKLFPGESALGKRVRRADRAARDWYTIAGVVGSVRQESVTGDPAEVLYVPVLDQALDTYPAQMSLAIRTSLPPLSLAPSVRRLIQELDPAMPIANVRTMERIVTDSMARTSFTMLMLLLAAAAALFLGAVGIYGIISYWVSRRAHEIGIRMAVGARAADVSRLVLRQVVTVVLPGLVVGALAALALTRILGRFLFEVSPTDPASIAAMSILLLMVALLASYLPARRATRVDPMVALRAG